MRPLLTSKQSSVYNFIVQYQKENERSPSQDEISAECKIKQSNVCKYLDALDRKDYIVYYRNTARGIELIK